MNAEQLQILTYLLRATKKVPPQHRLEAIQMGPTTHYGLYQQEGDKEGMALYKPLVDLVNKVKSVEELEALMPSLIANAKPPLPSKPLADTPPPPPCMRH